MKKLNEVNKEITSLKNNLSSLYEEWGKLNLKNLKA